MTVVLDAPKPLRDSEWGIKSSLTGAISQAKGVGCEKQMGESHKTSN